MVAKLALVGFYLKTLQKTDLLCQQRQTGDACEVENSGAVQGWKSFPEFHVLKELGIDGSGVLISNSSSNILAKNQGWLLGQQLPPEIKN